MTYRFVVTGTDTGIGKTVFCAALMCGLEDAGVRPHYWKPVQSGLDEGADTMHVRRLTGLPEERFLPEAYVFRESLSPHRAAEIDGAAIDVAALQDAARIPDCDGTLVIEGAGGLMVPLSRERLLIDVFAAWNTPVILCAHTGLGTINHTLLSLEALRARGISVHGIAFVGEENGDNIRTIADFSETRILGRLPVLPDLNAQSLRIAFEENFNVEDFIGREGESG